MQRSETETTTSGAAAHAAEPLRKDVTMQRSETETTTSEAAAHAAETSVPGAGVPTKSRIMGIDAARGLALLSMVAVHNIGFNADATPTLNADGTPTIVYAVVAGKDTAIFALLAGVSLALMSGGRHPVAGRARTAVAVGLAVRALLIGFIGLALGYSGTPLIVILPYYGMLFLLAIPLIGLRPRVLACLAIVIALVVPAFTLMIADYLPSVNFANLTFGSLLHPYQLAIAVLITGDYPALAFMAYICAGLAIGRLKLSSPRVAALLLGGGLALAVSAWVTSSVLLLDLGGQQLLLSAAPPGTDPNKLLWFTDIIPSWWWLADRAPHSSTTIDLLFTMGVAVAVLGAMLLLTRVAAPVLRPLAAGGSMLLTIYSAHAVYMAFDPLGDYPFTSTVVQVAAALVFAVIWQRTKGRGPLETVVAVAAGRARRAVAALRATST